MGIEYLLIHVLGLVIGSAVTRVFLYFRSGHGTLHIDHSNPEKDLYRFEIDRLDNLGKKNRFVLNIEHHNDLPQK